MGKDEEVKKRIRYLREVNGLSFRQIEGELSIPRKRCSKLYNGELQGYITRASTSKLDEYRDLIRHWYNEHPSLKAIQVFERLKERGVEISYPSVTHYTKELRKKKTKCYWPLTFHPGEEAQVDWFFLNHPKLGKLAGFVYILSYSRFVFAHFFPRHSFEFFIEGHLMAFDFMAGIPHALRYDNLKSVVLKRKPLTYNPAFLEFARHYKFEIRLCNVACGNEKGRVERVIRTIRERFCNVSNNDQSIKALNKGLHAYLEQKNNSIHRSTDKMPIKLKAEERLRPLPTRAWLSCAIHSPKLPSKTGLMIFDTNQYSVPRT